MYLKTQFGEIWGLSWVSVAQIFEEHGSQCHQLWGMGVRVATLGRKRLEPADCCLRLYFVLVFVLFLKKNTFKYEMFPNNMLEHSRP